MSDSRWRAWWVTGARGPEAGGDRIWDDGGAVPIRDGAVPTRTGRAATAGAGGGVRAWRDPHSHQAGRGTLRDTGRADRVSATARQLLEAVAGPARELRIELQDVRAVR